MLTPYNCGLRLARRVLWTGHNLARRFLVYPRLSYSSEKCDAFYWIDGELYSHWYANTLYQLNNSLTPDQRDVFKDEVNRHEMEIVTQERIAMLEEEVENYKPMMLELEKSK
nr:DNA-(apurinic or apyrimidinic site) lyase 2 [Tanacetum cinerariifolium]